MDVYTDGSCITGPDGSRWAGSGIWFGLDDRRNTYYSVPQVDSTNQYAELYAIKLALLFCKDVEDMRVMTDSEYCINCLTKWCPLWEANGWARRGGKDILHLSTIRECYEEIKRRDARGLRTMFEHVKGHSSNVGNDGADKLACLGSFARVEQFMGSTFFFHTGPFLTSHVCEFSDGNVAFNCIEQYSQYKKALLFGDRDAAEKILAQPNPLWQKSIQVNGFDSERWSLHRESIVAEGMTHKLRSSSSMREELARTHKMGIAYASTDTFWGIGLTPGEAAAKRKWKGENALGRCLMQAREAAPQ